MRKLDKQMQINSTWRLEGLVVLAWALGRFELPPHASFAGIRVGAWVYGFAFCRARHCDCTKGFGERSVYHARRVDDGW